MATRDGRWTRLQKVCSLGSYRSKQSFCATKLPLLHYCVLYYSRFDTLARDYKNCEFSNSNYSSNATQAARLGFETSLSRPRRTPSLRASSLVDFEQHATVQDLRHSGKRLPHRSIGVRVEPAGAAASQPPSTARTGTVSTRAVVVIVCSGEHPAVCGVSLAGRDHQSIAGVSAVAVHRQLIVTGLIADVERRILRPVPQTISTLHLQTDGNILATVFFSKFIVPRFHFGSNPRWPTAAKCSTFKSL